ncbi:hypothetical protein [Algoriphagus sp.]|uniref:hypothetical protein n=1 Tax=Algoriphagus sp. TaxID=1872435 RepID=UPI00391C4856
MWKSLTLLALFLIFSQNLKAQNAESKFLIEEYLRQSEKQKKTGLIMLGAGAGSVILGTVLFGAGWNSGSTFAGGTGALLLASGSISTLVSIPVLVSSASNGRKAAKLGLGSTQIAAPSSRGIGPITYPSWIISIPLNSQKL